MNVIIRPNYVICVYYLRYLYVDKPVVVVVLDGVGENKEDQYNAVFMANNPTYKVK